MKIKDLIAKLKEHSEDMEVVISYFDSIGERTNSYFTVSKKLINHCNYTTKWESNIDCYSLYEETYVYVDQINGKKQDVQIDMQKKEVVVFEV